MRQVKRHVALLTEIIAPYRIPVFNALAARDDIDLHVIFLSETDSSLRQWRVYKDEIRFSYEILPAWRRRVGKYNLLLNRGVREALTRAQPHAVVCGGYSYLACWQAARWARRQGRPVLLWSESTANDLRRRHRVVEFMKTRFARLCTAFVAAGKASRDYLLQLGAPADRIFTAPDAVDVKLYARRAEETRQRAAAVRAQHDLPRRYFLYVGRLVPEKGIFDLLAAYSALAEHERSQIGLVFAGDGASRGRLAERAAAITPGSVRFSGFVHREELPQLYTLAEALVFPTHSDTWGLVVNEAMACSLPVIASDVAGCVPDLVEDGRNGFVFPAGNIGQLTRAMRTWLQHPELTAPMGQRSAQRIQGYTPELCADGLAKAVTFACDGVA